MGRLWNSFKIAFSMYSKIPMPKSDWTKENMRYIMCFFPLVGVLIGGVTWLWGSFGEALTESRIFYASVLVLIPVLITGGIHLDGLLDTSDALHSYQPKRAQTGDFKGLSCRSLCHYYSSGIFPFVSGCVQ